MATLCFHELTIPMLNAIIMQAWPDFCADSAQHCASAYKKAGIHPARAPADVTRTASKMQLWQSVGGSASPTAIAEAADKHAAVAAAEKGQSRQPVAEGAPEGAAPTSTPEVSPEAEISQEAAMAARQAAELAAMIAEMAARHAGERAALAGTPLAYGSAAASASGPAAAGSAAAVPAAAGSAAAGSAAAEAAAAGPAAAGPTAADPAAAEAAPLLAPMIPETAAAVAAACTAAPGSLFLLPSFLGTPAQRNVTVRAVVVATIAASTGQTQEQQESRRAAEEEARKSRASGSILNTTAGRKNCAELRLALRAVATKKKAKITEGLAKAELKQKEAAADRRREMRNGVQLLAWSGLTDAFDAGAEAVDAALALMTKDDLKGIIAAATGAKFACKDSKPALLAAAQPIVWAYLSGPRAATVPDSDPESGATPPARVARCLAPGPPIVQCKLHAKKREGRWPHRRRAPNQATKPTASECISELRIPHFCSPAPGRHAAEGSQKQRAKI